MQKDKTMSNVEFMTVTNELQKLYGLAPIIAATEHFIETDKTEADKDGLNLVLHLINFVRETEEMQEKENAVIH